MALVQSVDNSPRTARNGGAQPGERLREAGQHCIAPAAAASSFAAAATAAAATATAAGKASYFQARS
jgi:hypothetical protein